MMDITADPTQVIIIGGGPAGVMAGLLLARRGVRVRVLEKHTDFLRDFRGDTVHPSTMEVLDELGLLTRFLALPHNRVDRAEAVFEGGAVTLAEFGRLAVATPFIAMMPQWDFLTFLVKEARAFPGFALSMWAEVVGLVEQAGRVTGVRMADDRILAAEQLVIAADGRSSLVRRQNWLPIRDTGAPIDVFWFKVPKQGVESALRAYVLRPSMLVTIDRGDYWQCAYVIAKGSADAVRARGIGQFRVNVHAVAPMLDRLEEALPDWDAVKLLSVSLDRLTRWHRPGLLAIGDAAHAMSPVGGVGINLAIQDAVCAANVLSDALALGGSVDGWLPKIAARRMLPTRLMQAAQAGAHRFLLARVTGEGDARRLPLALRLFDRFPPLRALPARIIGLGWRREHVRTGMAAPPG